MENGTYCTVCDRETPVNIHADALCSFSSETNTMYMKVVSSSSRTVCGVCGLPVVIEAATEKELTERALEFFSSGHSYETQKPQGAYHGLSS